MWCQCAFAIVPFLVTLLVSSVASPLWTLPLHVVKAYIALSRRMSPKSDLKVLFKKKKNQRDKAQGSHVSRKTWKMIDQFYSHGKHMENEGKKCQMSWKQWSRTRKFSILPLRCERMQTSANLQESLINQINLYTLTLNEFLCLRNAGASCVK